MPKKVVREIRKKVNILKKEGFVKTSSQQRWNFSRKKQQQQQQQQQQNKKTIYLLYVFCFVFQNQRDVWIARSGTTQQGVCLNP